MSERTEYAAGEFCWVDLATTDPDAAVRLYGELLGVDAVPAGPPEETGGYGFFVKDGKQVAGYGPVQGEGQPPAWASYIKVADADAAADKIRSSGGQVFMGPFDLPAESGRMAVTADPTGAVVCIMEQRRHHGAELVNEVGTWTWNELATRDMDAAERFYSSVFGWQVRPSEAAPEGAPYGMWHVDGERWPEGIAGARVMGDETPPDVPPHWMVYFSVMSADTAVETVRREGGSVILEPIDVPVGRLAIFVDPQGATVGIIESRYPEPR